MAPTLRQSENPPAYDEHQMSSAPAPNNPSPSPRLVQIIVFFETITLASVSQLGQYYAEQAWFKDPFNEVTGHAPIRRIFGHMFEQVHEPRFVIIESVEQGDAAFLTWEFRFRMKRFDTAKLQVVRGASHLRFDADGRVSYHRDYWDAAEELYEKLPLVGSLMRFLKRQAT